MTGFGFVVILSGAKDLCVMPGERLLPIPRQFAMHPYAMTEKNGGTAVKELP